MSYKRRLDFDVADLRLVLYVEALALDLCVTAMGLSKNSAGKSRQLSKAPWVYSIRQMLVVSINQIFFVDQHC